MYQLFGKQLGNFEYEDRINCGEKAWNLDWLIKNGYQVPHGICIYSNVLEHVLLQNNMKDDFEQHLTSGINNSSRLMEILLNLTFDNEFIDYIETVLSTFNSKIVVRSSSIFEDQAQQSNAGQYKSFLNVSVSDVDKVLMCIRLCWASAFSPLILLSAKHQRQSVNSIGVIIQQQVDAEKAGVCFSRDPNNIENNNIIVEAVEGTAEDLVEGKEIGELFSLSRSSKVGWNTGRILSLVEIDKIFTLITSLEEKVGYPVDVEWAISDTEVHLIQIRPISWFIKPLDFQIPSVPCFVDIDDLEVAQKITSGIPSMTHLLNARTNKRHYFRNLVKKAGIHVQREGFIFIPPNYSVASNEIRSLIAHFRTPTIEVKLMDEEVKHILHSEFPKWIIKNINFQRKKIVLFINEFYDNVFTGFSSRLPDGRIYVEYIPGGFGGFMFGNLPFSQLWLSPKGELLEKQIRPVEFQWRLDKETLKMKKVPYLISEPKLSQDILRSINDLTNFISDNFKQARVEWIHSQNVTLIYDLSIEVKDLSEAVVNKNILSKGQAYGPAMILTDFLELDSIVFDRGVVVDLDFHTAFHSDLAERFRSALAKYNSPPIVVAPYPKPSLSLLFGSVAGFVFDYGALLSHLGIILREANIPAVIFPDATHCFHENDWLKITNGEVKIVPVNED